MPFLFTFLSSSLLSTPNMTKSADIRWRAVILFNYGGVPIDTVAWFLGVSCDSIKRWTSKSALSIESRFAFLILYSQRFFLPPESFNSHGSVLDAKDPLDSPSPRWPEEVNDHVKKYVSEHPCLYLQELQDNLRQTFPDLGNTSLSTICRALRHDLKLTRKKMEKRAREAIPQERTDFLFRLAPFYLYPEQLVFVDETSMDGRSAVRPYAWSAIGTPAIVNIPFQRGQRTSTLAAYNESGFIAWKHTTGTFSRQRFHDAFVSTILPHLNTFPMPNSIVIMDNAKIHMYKELEEVIESKGALLFYLPPYSPHINPIENAFALLKAYVTNYANLAFRYEPQLVLDVALPLCTRNTLPVSLIERCGYGRGFLNLKD